MARLDLKPIVKVDVNLALKAAARKGFNAALIVGGADVIPAEERIRMYTSTDAMREDGFDETSAEYRAAKLYFSQSPAPDKLYVGARGEGEEYVKAVADCRRKSSEWYELIPCEASDEEIKALAEYVETAQPDSVMMYTTASDEVLTDNEEDVMSVLKGKLFRRSFGLYCANDTVDSAAAVAGRANGLNSETAGSMFTLAYKTLVGVTPDNLSEGEVQTVVGSRTTNGKNGNVYVKRAEDYSMLQQGFMADGTSFDEVLGLDMLKNDIRLNVMDLLYSSRKIPQTDAGVSAIINVINSACNKHLISGFIAPGQWNGRRCLSLETGDYLEHGYLVQAESVDKQPQADRDKRIAPPIYVCIKLAGAIEYVIIEVEVNR